MRAQTRRFEPTKQDGRSAAIGGMLLLILIGLSGASGTVYAEPAHSIVQVSGDVEIGRGDPAVWEAARAGLPIEAGDRIRTGAAGRAEIRTAAGTLRVHENSLLRLHGATAAADRVELERGRSLFDVLRRDRGRRFEVQTPTVVVSVKGTRFSVESEASMGAVEVFHGAVGVREPGADPSLETWVREGFRAVGGPGRPMEIEVLDRLDAWDAWQDFSRSAPASALAPGPAPSEVERARELLHQSTAKPVLRRAAARRPELAKRLQQVIREGATNRGEETDRLEGIIQQVAPDRVQIEEDRDALDLLNVSELIGDGTFADGSTSLNLEGLQNINGAALSNLVSALDTIENQVSTGSLTIESGGEFLTQLEQQLISQGLDAGQASSIIGSLTGPVGAPGP